MNMVLNGVYKWNQNTMYILVISNEAVIFNSVSGGVLSRQYRHAVVFHTPHASLPCEYSTIFNEEIVPGK